MNADGIPTQRRATYRLQLRPEFDFAAVGAVAGYLAELGVSHVYCSPYTQAAAGSSHGYDVVDPTRISDELGGGGTPRHVHSVATAPPQPAARRGSQPHVDLRPAQPLVVGRPRGWTGVAVRGVLRHRLGGRRAEDSPSHPPSRAQRPGGTCARGWTDPPDARAWRSPRGVRRQSVSALHETVAELLAASGTPVAGDVADAVARLPSGVDEESRRQRLLARNALAERVAMLLDDSAAAAAVDAVLGEINTDVAALDRILNEQHHRLAAWTTAAEEVNYRRFFDITSLVALRMEDPAVFAESTALIADLVRRGDVDGLRIDHIDGLRRPVQYAERLRDATTPTTWLLAEKILERDEQPPRWALDGTTGYDFLAAVNGLFVDPDGREALVALHEEVTGRPSDFAVFALEGKRDVLRTILVSDVERLTAVLAGICDAYPTQRDHTHTELRDAIIELVAAIPVYRTYVDPRTPPPSDVDARIVRAAVAAARAGAPHLDGRLLDFIGDLWVLGEPEDVSTADAVSASLPARWAEGSAARTWYGSTKPGPR